MLLHDFYLGIRMLRMTMMHISIKVFVCIVRTGNYSHHWIDMVWRRFFQHLLSWEEWWRHCRGNPVMESWDFNGNWKRSNPCGTIGLINILEVTKATELKCPPVWNFNSVMICELLKVPTTNSMYCIELIGFIVMESYLFTSPSLLIRAVWDTYIPNKTGKLLPVKNQ